MKNKIMETTSNKSIFLDTSNEACLQFGFLHGEMALHPDGETKVTIQGVALGNDGKKNFGLQLTVLKLKAKSVIGEEPKTLLKLDSKRLKKL